MGRVTIEEALKKVSGHFELVLLATERAKQILQGNRTKIVKKSPKTHVTALREIEEGVAQIDVLRANLTDRVNNVRKNMDDQTSQSVSSEIIEELQNSTFIPGEVESFNETSIVDEDIKK
jgi:DNA-directed RNA polymerase subunit omega